MSGYTGPNAALPSINNPTDRDVLSAVRRMEALLDTGEAKVLGIPLKDCKVFDALKTDIPDTPGTDDLGLAETAGAALTAGDAVGADVVRKGAFLFVLPNDYIAEGDVTLRVRAKTTDIATNTSAPAVDAEAKLVGDAAVGSDICATAAQALTAAYANYDFTITGTTLAPGSVVQVILTLDSNDTGGATNSVATITKVELRYTGSR